MTETTYSIKDVTTDLGFLLTLTGIFEADDKGFWFDPEQDKRVQYKIDANSEPKEIVLFQDPLPKGDYYFFNPFAEGFGKKSPAVQFFYKTIRTAFNSHFQTAALYVAREILASKEDESKSLDHAVVRMSSVPVDAKKTSLFDLMDEKMIDEFEKLFERMGTDGMFVPYLNPQMTAKFKCDILTDDKWDEKYGKDIRKKSLLAFKALVMGVLGIKSPKDLEEFTVKYDPELKSSAKLHTTISVYFKLYARFNDILAEAYGSDKHAINLGALQEVIDRFPLAYAIAKHMVQPTLPKNQANDTSTVDTSRLSFANASGNKRFPGPEVVDDLGRRQRPGASLSFGQPAEQKSRFKPHIIGEVAPDPFAPATRANAGIALPTAGGFASGNDSWGVRPVGGYFGSPVAPMGSGFGAPGLDLNPPSNFGSPGTNRSYFG